VIDLALQGRRDLLRQVRDVYAFLIRHRSLVRRKLPRHEPHERGLSGAVPAKKHDALANLDLHVQPVDDEGPSEGDGYVV
ncbi:MAG: hypothetical protein PHS37_10120, partial [Candidatus Omnitrophica bacterium]|nr:hypothetical protein [Candidatus Omnitrophota bacterium]